MIIQLVCLLFVTSLSTLNSAVRVELQSLSNKKKEKYICLLLKYVDYHRQSHIYVTLDCDSKRHVFCSSHLLHLVLVDGD